MALMLSQMDATTAAGVVNGLPDSLRADVTYRLGTMESIPVQSLRDLESCLDRELESARNVVPVGGPKPVAEILNRTGRSTEKQILKAIDKQDAEFGEAIRGFMFVYDDIANLTDREIQIILKKVDSRDLAIGLKGACDELKQRVFQNLGESVAEKLKEEIQYTGPVRMSDVERVQKATVAIVRELEVTGEITVVRGDSNDKFV